MAHGNTPDRKWKGNWQMQWVSNTLHTTSEHGVSSVTTADAHASAASSRLNWRPRQFKWTCPFRRKTKSGFCACAITFQTQSTTQQVFGDTLLTCYLEGTNNDIRSTYSFFYNYTVPSHRHIKSCRPSPVLSWNTVSGISHPLSVCTLSWIQCSFILFSLYIYIT